MSHYSPASFLNLDVEIESAADLTPLADHLTGKAVVLSCGPTDSGFRLALEPLIEGVLRPDPLACTKHFLRLLEALPTDLANLWNSGHARVFDYGFDGGMACLPLQWVIPADSLMRIGGLRAAVRVTVYPSTPEASSAEDVRRP